MKSNADLAQRVTTIWTSFPLCYFKALYESIPRGIVDCKKKIDKTSIFFFLYFLDTQAL